MNGIQWRLTVLLLPIHELMTFWPGAKISTIAPKLENEALASAMVEAPTVIALGARAGEVFAASTFEFPAATCGRMIRQRRISRVRVKTYSDVNTTSGELQHVRKCLSNKEIYSYGGHGVVEGS